MFFYKSYNNIWIKSIRRGLLKVQPLILINCILLIILNIDNNYYIDLMTKVISDNWKDIFQQIYSSLYSITKILIIISISGELAKIRRHEKRYIKYMGNSISENIVGIIGVTSAFIFSNIVTMDGALGTGSNVIISSNWTMISIIVSIISSEVYIKIYYYILENKKNLVNNYDKVVRQSILAILPSIITVLIVMCVAFLIDSLYLNKIDLIDKITIHGSNNILNDIKYILIKNTLWIIGAHGGDLIIHGESFNRLYVDTFTNMGGAGSSICLIIAIILYSTNKYSKKISVISMIPSIFNINEIITYGLPILFNPIYIIPFILVPINLYITSHIAIEVGFIEMVNTNISWIDPIIFNAYKLTGGFNGLLVQVINIIIGVAIYTPFVKIADNMSKKERVMAFEGLKNEVFSGNLEKLDLSSGSDGIVEISIFLGEELKEIITDRSKNNNELYLEYQPQLNKKRNVVGVEALLRWNHKEFGNIAPNIIILIAEELGLIYDLGKWIAKESIEQLSIWDKELDKNIDMSINISTKQLTDDTFTNYIKDMIKIYNVNPNNIHMEITESFAIGEDDISKTQLVQLSDYGVKLAIDDFGVGYNPLLYIKKYNISYIKIDGSLIRDIDKNEDSKSIVSSVYSLCNSTGITVVNEFVETEQHKEVLDAMGDGLYQGYLFSKPLKADECLEYIKNNI
ncbi:EAL domain-containing protein [Romboutsia sp.]|uniref:EAL domain-containing protein n=1 Tax=Romboutsia sp. TaxID=1965302 RepID=UPI003F6758B8